MIHAGSNPATDTKNKSMAINKKETRGGKQPGAGRPLKYGEPLKNVHIRVPQSKVWFIKGVIKDHINKWVVKK